MDVNDFVADYDVRLTWIAFFTLWVLWGFVYFVRHVFGEDTEKPAPAQDSEQAGESKPTKKKWKPEGSFGVSTRRHLFIVYPIHSSLLLLYSRVLPTLIVFFLKTHCSCWEFWYSTLLVEDQHALS